MSEPATTSRQWLTYAEARQYYSERFHPISDKTLRRTPLLTKRVGRNRLINREHLHTVGEERMAAAPEVLFASPRGNPKSKS